jgi:hypothetical protein
MILVGQKQSCRTYTDDTSSCMSFPRTILYLHSYEEVLLNSQVAYSCFWVVNQFNVLLFVMPRHSFAGFLYRYQFIEMKKLSFTRRDRNFKSAIQR